MEIIKRNIKPLNEVGKKIDCDIRYPDTGAKLPLVFIMHGFKGFKDWGFFPYVSDKISKAGAITVCFNFSMNGMEADSDIVTYPEDFAENTVSREILDAKLLIDYVLNDKEIQNIWDGKIYLAGHSMGAAVALLITRKNEKISKLALWGPIAKFDRYSPRQKQYWQKIGFLEFTNARTGQELRLNISFLNDFENNIDKFNLPVAAKELKIPLLIVHGRQDLTVNVKDAMELAEAYGKKEGSSAILEIIEQTGHTFGINHPFEGSTEALDKVVDMTIKFLGLK